MIKKPNAKQVLLVTALVIVTALVLRQYLPMLQIPTKGLIEEENLRLQSLMGDLAVQKKTNEDWNLNIEKLRKNSAGFWFRARTGIPVEQEVLEEFNTIASLAAITVQSREAKLLKAPGANYVQEVELRLELKGVSMKDFSRFLKELSRNKRKFYWASCKIDPDNVQNPTALRVVGSLRAYMLNEDAMRVLTSGGIAEAKAAAPAKEPEAVRRSGSVTTGTGKVRNSNAGEEKK